MEKLSEEGKDRMCATHQQPLVLYCNEEDCQIAICAFCIPDNHPRHNVVKIESKGEHLRAELQEKITKAYDLKRKVTYYLNKLSGANEHLTRIGNNAIDSLNHRYDVLNRALLEARKRIYDKIVCHMLSEGAQKFLRPKFDLEKKGKMLDALIERWENIENPHHALSAITAAESKFREIDIALDLLSKSITFTSVAHFDKGPTIEDSIFGTFRAEVVHIPDIFVEGTPGVAANLEPIEEEAAGIESAESGSDLAAEGHEPELQESTFTIAEELRKLIIVKKSKPDVVIDWIEHSIESHKRNSREFVHALVMIVCMNAIEISRNCESDNHIVDTNDPCFLILLRYLRCINGSIEHQIEAMMAVQSAAKIVRTEEYDERAEDLLEKFYEFLLVSGFIDTDGLFAFIHKHHDYEDKFSRTSRRAAQSVYLVWHAKQRAASRNTPTDLEND